MSWSRSRPRWDPDWTCPLCLETIFGSKASCVKCKVPKVKKGDWVCQCRTFNFGSRTVCMKCQAQKPECCQCAEPRFDLYPGVGEWVPGGPCLKCRLEKSTVGQSARTAEQSARTAERSAQTAEQSARTAEQSARTAEQVEKLARADEMAERPAIEQVALARLAALVAAEPKPASVTPRKPRGKDRDEVQELRNRIAELETRVETLEQMWALPQ